MSFTKLVLLLILGSSLVGCNDTGEPTVSTHNTTNFKVGNHAEVRSYSKPIIGNKQDTQKIGKYDYIKNPQQAIKIFGNDYTYRENLNGSYCYNWADLKIMASMDRRGNFRVFDY